MLTIAAFATATAECNIAFYYAKQNLIFKVSVNENFSTLLDFVFLWIFGMSGS